jgi:hypothetical protein
MSDAVEPLILDLLEWVAGGERDYAEMMDAWRTSCPRLPVWEEANARGLVTRIVKHGTPHVAITAAGRRLLEGARRGPADGSHHIYKVNTQTDKPNKTTD